MFKITRRAWCAALLAASLPFAHGCEGEPVDPYFELGQGESLWQGLEGSTRLKLVLGGQGAFMFPIAVRGAGFVLPDNPTQFNHPDAPVVDITVEIEGYANNSGVFARLTGFPIPFTILDDGTYEYFYIAVLAPDSLADPMEIHNKPVKIEATLTPIEGEPMTHTYEMTVLSNLPPLGF